MPTLEFDPVEHRYQLDGRPVPSVTQVLDPLLELWRVPADVLEAAAAFGTHVHMAVDLFNKGELDEAELDPALAPYLQGWKAFLYQTGSQVADSEFRVYHDFYGYAGTLDTTVLMPGRRGRGEVLTLADVKSGVVPITVGLQTAAYEAARRSMGLAPCRDRLCVQLFDQEPFFRLHVLNDPSDWSLFLSALNVHKFKEKHNVRS